MAERAPIKGTEGRIALTLEGRPYSDRPHTILRFDVLDSESAGVAEENAKELMLLAPRVTAAFARSIRPMPSGPIFLHPDFPGTFDATREGERSIWLCVTQKIREAIERGDWSEVGPAEELAEVLDYMPTLVALAVQEFERRASMLMGSEIRISFASANQVWAEETGCYRV